MSFSSHELILTSSPDGPIMVYDTVNRTAVTRFSGSRSPCRGLTMAGRRLLAVSHVSSDTGAGSINVYNWHGSTVFRNFPLPEAVAPIVATSDGTFLFGGGISGRVLSLSGSSGDVIRSVAAHSSPVSSLHLSDDGSLVISGSEDGTIVVVPTFKMVVVGVSSEEEDMDDLILHKWKAHSDSVTALKSVMGTLVSCSLDGTCKFWNLGNCGILMRTVTFPCSIFGVVLDSTGSAFYAAGSDGFVYHGLVKVESRKLPNKVCEVSTWPQGHSGSIVSLVLVNEERNLVSAAENGSVWMWNVKKGEVILVFGDELINISDMIVMKGNIGGFGVGKRNNVAVGEGNGLFTSSGLCDQEMIKTLKQITELGEIKDVVVQDKKKAIDMLESAIEMYERLLKLILKEATKAIEEEEEDEDDREEQQAKDDKKEDH
ncbi:unnamed protein product [Sphenostylis stenocarpa]|uniref:Uncharacterized protein n=1 Tax=Sphenostylis stenocarpa TaxID=92480 RepID=A0AA87B8V9_9FABA|nr:unnamed protein product [Sphenostylis stenocarpa]